MRRSLLTFVLALSVFLIPAVRAQQPSSQQTSSTTQVPPQDPQAIAILHRSLVAMGGQGVASIQDTIVHATSTPAPNSGGEPGDVTITTKGARLIRFDGSANAKNASTIYNAGRESRSTDNGWRSAPGANAHHRRLEHLPALMLAYEIARGDHSCTYVAEETVETRAVHHIRVARDPQRGDAMDARMMAISQLDIFIDAQTLLITKVAFPYASEIDWRITFPVEIYYDQYQVVNGIAVPYRQRYFLNGQPISVMQITSVAANQNVSDTLFEAK